MCVSACLSVSVRCSIYFGTTGLTLLLLLSCSGCKESGMSQGAYYMGISMAAIVAMFYGFAAFVITLASDHSSLSNPIGQALLVFQIFSLRWAIALVGFYCVAIVLWIPATILAACHDCKRAEKWVDGVHTQILVKLSGRPDLYEK